MPILSRNFDIDFVKNLQYWFCIYKRDEYMYILDLIVYYNYVLYVTLFVTLYIICVQNKKENNRRFL